MCCQETDFLHKGVPTLNALRCTMLRYAVEAQDEVTIDDVHGAHPVTFDCYDDLVLQTRVAEPLIELGIIRERGQAPSWYPNGKARLVKVYELLSMTRAREWMDNQGGCQ